MWWALTVVSDADTAESAAEYLAPGVSMLYTDDLSPANEFGVGSLTEAIELHMGEPPATSICPHLYPMVSHLMPFINSYFKNQLVNGVFLTASMGDPTTILQGLPSVAWFLPPYHAAPGYHEAAAAATYGKRPGKRQDQQMMLYGQAAEVNHLISALLHLAATVAVFANPPEGQTPVLVLVCEAMALILHRQNVRMALQSDYTKLRVRCHHALALIHDILSSLIKKMTSTRTKQLASNTGRVPASPVQETFRFIRSTFEQRLRDLEHLKLDEDLVTFAADISFVELKQAQQKQQAATSQRASTTVRHFDSHRLFAISPGESSFLYEVFSY